MTALGRWWTLDAGLLAPAAHNDAVALIGADLQSRWAEPTRRYHTATHLVEMFWALEELEAAGELTDREAAVARVAAWFHDAVYDPAAAYGDNEAASTVLARDALHTLGFAAEDAEAVDRLITLTIRHETEGLDRTDDAFHDADLWILSSPEQRFDAYCAQVRQEYVRVEDTAYRTGRSAILEPLLRRNAVYRTSHARREWEPAARANLARELARLRAPDPTV